MPVPLAGFGDTVGVRARWSLRHLKGFCGRGCCKRNLRGTELHLWKWERQHGLSVLGMCIHMCYHMHFFWYLHAKQWWKGIGLQVPLTQGWPGLLSLQILVCWQGGLPTAVCIPLNRCSFELGFSKVAWFSCPLCLVPCSLLGIFTLFIISFSLIAVWRNTS